MLRFASGVETIPWYLVSVASASSLKAMAQSRRVWIYAGHVAPLLRRHYHKSRELALIQILLYQKDAAQHELRLAAQSDADIAAILEAEEQLPLPQIEVLARSDQCVDERVVSTLSPALQAVAVARRAEATRLGDLLVAAADPSAPARKEDERARHEEGAASERRRERAARLQAKAARGRTFRAVGRRLAALRLAARAAARQAEHRDCAEAARRDAELLGAMASDPSVARGASCRRVQCEASAARFESLSEKPAELQATVVRDVGVLRGEAQESRVLDELQERLGKTVNERNCRLYTKECTNFVICGRFDGCIKDDGTLVETKTRRAWTTPPPAYDQIQLWVYLQMLRRPVGLLVEKMQDGSMPPRDTRVAADLCDWSSVETALELAASEIQNADLDAVRKWAAAHRASKRMWRPW